MLWADWCFKSIVGRYLLLVVFAELYIKLNFRLRKTVEFKNQVFGTLNWQKGLKYIYTSNFMPNIYEMTLEDNFIYITILKFRFS